MKQAVLLVAHGTVDALSDLPAFVTNIRRGHAPPPELIAELTRRYEAIGGRSPLNAITRDVAAKLEARLRVPVRMAMRLWRPYPREVIEALEAEGVTHIAVVPLAQHSAYVYEASVRDAVREAGSKVEVACAPNWGQSPRLTHAFADALVHAIEAVPESSWAQTTVLMTAHSLPLFILRGGDPYETEVRASAAAVFAEVQARLGARAPKHEVAFQSQGMSQGPGGKPVEWLGPDLVSALDAAKARGDTHVVVAPVGFLADHVEILYDLDVEATAWARERGLTLTRTASLNASQAFIETLAAVAEPLLGAAPGGP